VSAEHRDRNNRLLGGRVERLRSELANEDVPITDAAAFPPRLSTAWSDALQIVCEEIVHARYVEVHEGYRPSYGCLLVPDLNAINPVLGLSLASLTPQGEPAGDPPAQCSATGGGAASDDTSPESDTRWVTDDRAADLRLIVDGDNTFLVRDLHGRSGFGTVAASDELELLELSRALSGVCVQRLRDGRIQLLMNGVVCINDGYDWRSLVTASEMLPKLVTSLEPPAHLLDEVSVHLGEILDLCVHLLSPRGIGATLVWRIGDGGPRGALSNHPSPPPASLNVFRKQDRFAIVSLLASVDGACFVASDGTLVNYWAMLDPSVEAKERVVEQGGTRHTSAKRYSFDEPGCLVIVVSADGPVSVFSDGARLVRFADTSHDSGRGWMTRLMLEEAAQIDSREHLVACQTCSKQLRVEVDRHPSAGETVDVSCPVCASEGVGVYENVVQLKVWVAKVWETGHPENA
jgi:DNA integrity scanning protein DisA with diadenylate cyclase activity